MRPTAVLIALALLVGACGGDSAATTATTTATTTLPPPTTTIATTTTLPPTTVATTLPPSTTTTVPFPGFNAADWIGIEYWGEPPGDFHDVEAWCWGGPTCAYSAVAVYELGFPPSEYPVEVLILVHRNTGRRHGDSVVWLIVDAITVLLPDDSISHVSTFECYSEGEETIVFSLGRYGEDRPIVAWGFDYETESLYVADPETVACYWEAY